MKALSTCPVIITALILQGCVAAVVGSAAIATKTVTDPRSVGTQVDDATLELRINNRLSKDIQIRQYTHIVATAYQGKVLLTGQSPCSNLAQRAKQIAISVDGTTKVYNQIRTGDNISLRTASLDSWITIKVRTQLLRSNEVKSSNVKVTTENGEVFLLGIVTSSEAAAAANIASRVKNVKHVNTAFTILK